MESIARSKAVLELGKRLVAQLGLEGDLLAQWMAHDIAARIAAIENAPEVVPMSTRDECAKAILTLWEHRNDLPPHLRPFKEIEPVTKTLTALDVDHGDDYRYFHSALREAALDTDDEQMREWLELAFSLDHSARVLIQYALRSAGAAAASQVKPWMENALQAGVGVDPDRQTIDFLLERMRSTEAEGEEEQTAILMDGLRDKISKLENFAKLASAVAADLRGQLHSEPDPSSKEPGAPHNVGDAS
ncbi:hypothetical protein D3C76_1142560 [compost metagenome]